MVRHTRAEADRTRTRVLEAALMAFAEGGVRGTTLDAVAARAGVTRGAVYWHFTDKAALVAELVESVRWPLDIGADVAAYEVHPQPLELLREQLCRQIEHCMADPWQSRAVKIVLRHGVWSELPLDAVARVEDALTETVWRLARVMTIAHRRYQLRAGLHPASAARCLHAVGIGILSEYASDLLAARRNALPLCLELFMVGASSAGVGGFNDAPPDRSASPDLHR
ncbi:TetR family transcriptional regulator [Variovorax ginsengisoli]|uniref:TetR/AcrR family acrAB operon transcriptional repressor n=1 Tax=Variovorax ginsengisoli TaxID=363844 RepID=A0ABT9SDZ8_9BURK|nr:TetR family transcriptional regulator [Variovorax ginsengisoli]MDP9902590.1 TetR/AcrR family acrAB operon transcriptional repressor [Variovorax ginsengisoli]